MKPSAIDWSLYLVTDPHLGGGRDNVVSIVSQAVAGGATVVQLRDKDASDSQIETIARQLLEVLGDVPLFLNDRVEVARRLGCHLHIGQSDMPYPQARALLPREKMIGLSVGTDEELDDLLIAGQPFPDVIGIGPVFNTATKGDAPAGRGVESVDGLAQRARAAGIKSVAIGGIDATRAPLFRDTAVDGICVVSAIMAAKDVKIATQELKKALSL